MRPATKKSRVERAVAAETAQDKKLAGQIHALAEPAFKEEGSARLVADYLAGHGFRAEFPFRNIPTALRATWGRGKPVVGMLGEYDALPNCGQEEGTWGHGCGHHLLGVGAAVGAVAAKSVLEAARMRGTVVYYGCPAEETLAGKVYMARDGAFRDLTACLAWHPSGTTGANNAGGSALDSLVYEFFGRTAHGASAHHGRSALDAAVLLDVAANYLREHIPENVRIHSVVRDGGDAPNVVPAYAKTWYYVRGKDRAEVDAIRKRLDACARGATTATETRMKVTRLTAVYSRLPNDALAETVRANLVLFGPPAATASDRRRVKALGLKGKFAEGVAEGLGTQGRGSSDEDNVSWLVPLGRFTMACVAKGTPGHHRRHTAQGAMPFARRGMLQAAKVFAGAALDLCSGPKLLRTVRAEFRKRTRDFTYDPLIPKRQRVPIDPP